MSLVRLIYSSRATGPSCLDTVLEITGISTRNNSPLGITGLLLLTGGHYLQVLEGEGGAISDRFLCIAKDPRHSEIVLRLCVPTTTRLFSDWAMHGAWLSDCGKEGALAPGRLAEVYGREGDGLAIPEHVERCLALLLAVRQMLPPDQD